MPKQTRKSKPNNLVASQEGEIRKEAEFVIVFITSDLPVFPSQISNKQFAQSAQRVLFFQNPFIRSSAVPRSRFEPTEGETHLLGMDCADGGVKCFFESIFEIDAGEDVSANTVENTHVYTELDVPEPDQIHTQIDLLPNPSYSSFPPMISSQSLKLTQGVTNAVHGTTKHTQKTAKPPVDWSVVNKSKFRPFQRDSMPPAQPKIPLSQALQVESKNSVSFVPRKRPIIQNPSNDWRKNVSTQSQLLAADSSVTATQGQASTLLKQCILEREKFSTRPSLSERGIVVMYNEQLSVLRLVLWMQEGELRNKLAVVLLSSFVNRTIGIRKGFTVELGWYFH